MKKHIKPLERKLGIFHLIYILTHEDLGESNIN